MRMLAVEAQLPSRVVSADDIVGMCRERIPANYPDDADAVLSWIADALIRIEGKERRWRAEGETAIGLVTDAIDTALESADVDRTDIDVIIHVGVGRGVLEPGQAHLVALNAGMYTAECFDVLDACNSFARALRLARGLFATEDYAHILIVNTEFGAHEGGPLYKDGWTLPTAESLQWEFPMFTIGEAAAATILGRDESLDWVFTAVYDTSKADLCTLTLPTSTDYLPASPRIGLRGEYAYLAHGREIKKWMFPAASAAWGKVDSVAKTARVIFPHTHSGRDWRQVAQHLGDDIEERLHMVFPRYGNVVSASLPVGLWDARKAGVIESGDRFTAILCAAGMSFVIVSSEL